MSPTLFSSLLSFGGNILGSNEEKKQQQEYDSKVQSLQNQFSIDRSTAQSNPDWFCASIFCLSISCI